MLLVDLCLRPLDAADGKLNVLLICSDDMRPQLGCYGDPTATTPNIDRLAARGMLFEHSYVSQALCSPSRISMLSGRYPATTQIFEIGRPLRATMPDITTVPQHFKNHGYHCRSFGDVYYVGIDDAASWNETSWQSTKPRYGAIGQAAMAARRREYDDGGTKPPARGKGGIFYAGPAFEATDLGDDELLVGDTAAQGIDQLRQYAKNPDQPFFLAVGFSNPHAPCETLPKRSPCILDVASQAFRHGPYMPQERLWCVQRFAVPHLPQRMQAEAGLSLPLGADTVVRGRKRCWDCNLQTIAT
jgi:iduronate 2-sulfatase